MRDTFDTWGGRGQFAGHETFPLRLLWLKKAYDAVEGGASIGVFHEPDAIARFGVGRNMAVSMRYWALAAGIIQELGKGLSETELGRVVFSQDGWDPYLERASTLWLTHWNLASDPAFTTTIYFAFNAVAAMEFEAASLVQGLDELVRRKGWRAAPVTLRRDVEVFLRSYARRSENSIEDAAEPLLAELGLVRDVRPGGWFEFVRGPKPTLPDGVFGYALSSFWNRHHDGVATLSAEQICYAPGSPGRVFKLDEDSVVTRLMRLEQLTEGAWIWTDTAGLRQVQKQRKIDLLGVLATAYPRSGMAAGRRAA
jgi:Protein of unknown function (DUF4007)